MTTIIRQTALLPAGCQPWNLNMVASCGPNFVYCATLAVYIYECDTKNGFYKLSSINAVHTKTVTCISWNRDNTNLFATGGADEKICIWDISLQKCINTKDQLGFTPVCIGWIPGKDGADVLAFCGKQGGIQLWNIKNNGISQVDYTSSFDHEITLFRWHHSETAKFMLGHADGSLSLHISGKRNKHVLKGMNNASSKNADPVLQAIWDPLSSEYLLVSRKQSGIQLVDVKAVSVITRFNLPNKMVSAITMSWVNSAPGMFITGDHESGVLRVWSVSQSVPLENINLKATGFQCLTALDTVITDANSRKQSLATRNSHDLTRLRSSSVSSAGSRSCTVPPAKVVCAFADGGVGLFNLQMRKWEFLREQGHIETIFDCKFKPNDAKILATASFDGTVKVWSSVDLSPLATSPGNEGVIYSLAWSPGDQNCIACGTRRRGVFIWDMEKLKFIKRFKEHGMYAVYCVAWNQLDSQRLASCSDDGTCVVRKMDSREVKVFRHPDSTFGCEWNPIDKDLLATGCNDGVVRIWMTENSSPDSHRNLYGHEDKVFHVRWHPLIKNIICSGSDDKTIRVWEIESQSCTALLKGHTSSVRGLCWNFEIPYLLASGSWDSSLRLWDVRDEKCVDIVLDHVADVYGLTSHPNNPFIMATSSRDSTLRLWSLSHVTRPLSMQIVSGMDSRDIVASPEEAIARGSSLKLAGNMSKEVMGRLKDSPNSDSEQLRFFSELFSSSSKLERLWDLVCVVRGQKESSLSADYKSGIVHIKHLTKYKSAEARTVEHSLTRRTSGVNQARSRDVSLMQIALVYLKLGDVKRYCEILVQMGLWERALAFAPAVSQGYWSQLVTRYADTLRTDDEDDAITYYIASGNIREAVQCMTSRNDYQDALLLSCSAVEGNCPAEIVEDSHVEASSNKDDFNDLVTDCCKVLAERYYNNADPFNAASIYLAHDDVTSAINCLVKSNKLFITLCLSRSLNKTFDGTVVAAGLLARSCELDYPSVAVKLLKRFDPSCLSVGDEWTSLHGVCARYSGGDDGVKERLHAEAGIPSPKDCLKQAVSMDEKGRSLDAINYFLLSSTPEKGLELGLTKLKQCIAEDDWTMDDVMKDLQSVFCVPERILRDNSYKSQRTELLTMSAYFGALLAFRRKYNSVLVPLYQYAISMCELCSRLSPDFTLSLSQLQEELAALNSRGRSGSRNDVIERVRHRAGKEVVECMIGDTVANASDLPCHSEAHTSTITKERINGGAYVLDDRRSVLSFNEAIMWAKCNEFSPTSSGARICPF